MTTETPSTESPSSEQKKTDKIPFPLALDLVFKKGYPIYVAKGMSKAQMEVIYAKGYSFYSTANYVEAKKFFRTLAFYSHLDKRAWIGLGGCCHMLQEYNHAVSFFYQASALEPDDPVAYLHLFNSLMALKKDSLALIAIEKVILFSSKNPTHAALKKRGELLRDSLEKDIAKNENK